MLKFKTKTGFLTFKPYIFTPLHLHKPYLAHLKTNSNDFCDIKCIKK